MAIGSVIVKNTPTFATWSAVAGSDNAWEAADTTMAKVSDSASPASSVTRYVTVRVCAVVGVPLRTRVFALNVRPAGRLVAV